MNINKRIIIAIIIIAIVGASSIILVLVNIFPEGKKAPSDLTDKGDDYSDFTPTAVKPGFTNFQVWCTINNLGQSSSGDFNISFYASINTIITADDYLIGIDKVSSISSLNEDISTWSGIFPNSGIPDGMYYIGWIIDSDHDVSESDETNNIAYESSYQLIVDSVNPSSSISYTPESLPNIISDSTTFTLLADDGTGSGVDHIEYRIDNGLWASYTGPFALGGYAKRNHTIEYYSIDNVDNQESVNSEIVNIDIPGLHSGLLFAPGAPIDTPEDQIIKIGVLADLNDITGEGTFQGSYLAIKQINQIGGVNISSSTYYFGLIAENTYEAEVQLDITKGLLAAEKMMTQHDPDFVMGGFRTESLMAYRERVMDEQKIFINTGAATDTLCETVASNYAKYKYFFRSMPINSSSLAKEIVEFYALTLKPALEAALGTTVDKVAILREDLEWTTRLANILKGYYVPSGYYGLNNNPWFNFTIVTEIAYPITADSYDFITYLNQMESDGAQIVCPIISSQGGIYMMTQYNNLKPEYIIAGIDVTGQLGDDPDDTEGYWNITGGTCAYELLMQSTTRKNKTVLTVAFWDDYVYSWNKDPLYTAIGSYDSVLLLLDAINAAQSIDSDIIVAQLETINKINPFEGTGGNVAFNSYHDLIEGYDQITKKIYSVALWVQWQSGGTKSIVTSSDYIYPEWIVDAPMQIPPWL
ncbi:MAG: OmpL47-type beta-barrel domain-containing protein [Promethearchaeota archaeon]